MAHACSICGKPTEEFFRAPDGRRFVHAECLLAEGKKLVESGEVDDVRIVTQWPDGSTEIGSGRTTRKGLKSD